MVVKYNRDDANFILECLKDYKRLVKKYYGHVINIDRLGGLIEMAENAKLESLKEKQRPSEDKARGATCEECE